MTLDDEDIERIAQAVARRLAEHAAAPAVGAHTAGRLVDAATVARALGVRRDWVYAHADQLGAIRLGGGRGRLRFDPARLPNRSAREQQPAPAQRRCIPGRRRRRSRPSATPVARPVRLLPYLVESRHTIEMAGRRANAPGPTPGG